MNPILRARSQLAAALNQHCGGEERRKEFMWWLWKVKSLRDLTNNQLMDAHRAFNPQYLLGEWALSNAAFDQLRKWRAQSV